ncbi:MAG: PAS domain S-box protein, partial [Nitrospirae bacterium]
RVSDAPQEIIKRYGTKGGFNWPEGKVVGVETVEIPIEDALNNVTQLVVSIFITGLVGVFFMFISLNYYINRVAVSPIKKISRFFKSVVQGKEGLTTRFPVTSADEIGELARSFNQMMDHLRESQERLRISEQKYRRVFEDSKDTIMVADCEGFIIDINPAGVDMFGCKKREHIIKTKSIYDLFLEPEEYTRFVKKMKKEGFVKDYETVLKTVDGRTINALITATLRYDEENKLCGFDAIIKDITTWKKLQEQMARADKLASVGQLAAGVAHEINNPLGIIMGYTGMLLSEDGLPPEVKEDLQTIYQNAETCKKIIEDLLKFSRQSPAKHEPVDLNALIEEVSGLLSYQIEEKEIIFKKDLNDIPTTMADPLSWVYH